MWKISDFGTGETNKVTIPSEGLISIDSPKGVKVKAYVNDAKVPMHHLHVNTGDIVHFELKGATNDPTMVVLKYGEDSSTIIVPPRESKEENMDTSNLFAVPTSTGTAAGGMAGLGSGLLGGILGGALLGNRRGGLFGGDDGARIDPFQNQANMSIMATLGDIKASVPLAEGQSQLALANAQMNITNAVTSGTGAVIGAVSAFENSVMSNLNMQTQMNQKGFADTTAAVVSSGTANLLATKDLSAQTDRNSWAITQAITNDGDKTRALIQSIDKSNDSRLITDLSNQITELRNEGRLNAATGSITISNNNAATANAQQAQAQQQAQQLALLSAQVAALIQQNQHIQQGVLNIGSGTVSGNSQNAANTRVAA
jgi:hypothetical protein